MFASQMLFKNCEGCGGGGGGGDGRFAVVDEDE